MNTYLAHSAGEHTPAQTYFDHVNAVVENASRFARDAERYSAVRSHCLQNTVSRASEFHDLGKLDPENQRVLHQGDPNKKLPVNHVDAGTAYCLPDISAITIYSHHKGLPDFSDERKRGMSGFRDDSRDVREHIDTHLGAWAKIHHSLRPGAEIHDAEFFDGDQSIFHRLALSCLADADHSDTARARGTELEEAEPPKLMPGQRLSALERYVKALRTDGAKSKRNELRDRMFESCRDADIQPGVVACDSPVGSGKTTAVMAHLLRQAEKMGARRIFVVLPFTNIITQSVNVYRKALTLPGEDPKAVVAELHHRADFENEQTRYLSARWRAPIIVTTAVAFFETMASNRPSVLRRLHELPGSIIFVDEAHAALPVPLLPVSWKWIQTFADEWNCHWVLASGSLVRFWKLEEISEEYRDVPELISDEFRNELSVFEDRRISYPFISRPLSRGDLLDIIAAQPGPRLLIVNTVKTAAVLANDIKNRFGEGSVEHLSTALSPKDRETELKKIKDRLEKAEKDDNWTLVATSCVEAGVDLSFKTGFRELASLLSLLQAAGRINRSGIAEDAQIFSFEFQDDPMLTRNPGVEHAAKVLRRYFEREIPISPELSTDAIQRELDEYGTKKMDLLAEEDNQEFKTVADGFQVIDSDTVLAVVDHSIAEQIRFGKADWRLVQRHSVSVQRKIQQYHLKEIAKDIFEWTLPYNPFLGIMAGIITEKTAKEDFLCI